MAVGTCVEVDYEHGAVEEIKTADETSKCPDSAVRLSQEDQRHDSRLHIAHDEMIEGRGPYDRRYQPRVNAARGWR